MGTEAAARHSAGGRSEALSSARRPDAHAIRVRRRAALLVAAVFVVFGLEVLLGPADERARHGASLHEVTIESKDVGESLPIEVVVPAGADQDHRRPLLIFLHGRGAHGERDNLNSAMYGALADQGKRAPIVAFPSGGDHSYWHDRADGAWGSYVVDEVIPTVVHEFPADPRRVAIGGISMGGFGALDIARLHPGRFCAVGGHSPAIWRSGSETAPGAFDDEADFERHDVLETAVGSSAPYLGIPVWVDAGDRDPFRHTGLDEFAEALRAHGAELTFHIWPGTHGGDYWRSHWEDYLRFYARALARCHR
jgi:S-formylglutathione hydrolase FrmB